MEYMMKRMKHRSIFIVLTIIGILASCVTLQDRMLPQEERASIEIIGRVNTSFLSLQMWHKISSENIAERIYSKLMEEARKIYHGNIDVVNITADGNFNSLTLLPLPCVLGIFGNFQTVNASGDVILYSRAFSSGISQEKLAEAVRNLSFKISESLTNNSTIAVLNIYSSDSKASEYIVGELEYNLVNSGRFIIVDRRRLDQIRSEQNFQLSGDVDDNSAVSIGQILGANIVITGEITGSGSNQRLVIKALDVKTAQIVSMAREQL